MSLEGNLEYALARVQCQYGNRLGMSEWRGLEAGHDLGQFLEAARTCVFNSWVAGLDRSREAHFIERTLRGVWRSYVRAVAAWHPRRCQPWLMWLEWLPTLGLIARPEHANPAPAWLLTDPVMGNETAIAFFEPAIAGRITPAELWLARWRQLKPHLDASTEQLLAAVLKAVQEHGRMLALDGADGVALREQLGAQLSRLFRAAAGTLVATLCHLALMALDFERLRGGLVNRSLFARG
jgi:hypothetical protein